MKKEKNKKKEREEGKVSRAKLIWLKILDIFVTILPLIVLVIIRHEEYIYSVGSAVGFSVGAIIAIVVIVLTVLDKLHLKGLGFAAVGLALCYFLRNVLNDIEWIFLCMLIGQIASKVVKYFIKREEENVTIEKTARETSKQVKAVMKDIFIGSGRV